MNGYRRPEIDIYKVNYYGKLHDWEREHIVCGESGTIAYMWCYNSCGSGSFQYVIMIILWPHTKIMNKSDCYLPYASCERAEIEWIFSNSEFLASSASIFCRNVYSSSDDIASYSNSLVSSSELRISPSSGSASPASIFAFSFRCRVVGKLIITFCWNIRNSCFSEIC